MSEWSWRDRWMAVSCLLVACGSPSPGDDFDASIPEAKGLAEVTQELTAEQAALARWSPVITLPIVPVSAANLPDGKVLLWSAEGRFDFGQDLGRTYSMLFDPETLASTERLVSETQHDMFC